VELGIGNFSCCMCMHDKVEGFLISKRLGVSSFSNNKFVVLGIQSILKYRSRFGFGNYLIKILYFDNY
jgi:hypothetical protein